MKMTSSGCGTLAVCAAAVLAATVATPVRSAEEKDVTIALFVAIQANPVEQAIINAFTRVAEEDGAARFVVFDSDNSVQKELANCNDAIAAKRFDAFALKPVAGPPLMACATKALDAGIPVVAFGNALGPDPDTAERQIDRLSGSVIELAKTNGLAIAELVNAACAAKQANPCSVIYTHGPLAFDWASISRKFFLETVAAEHKNVTIVATGPNNFDPNTARTLTKSLMLVHADVDVIAADADLGALGVVAALKDLGKVPGKDVLVTGGAFSHQGKGLVEAGEMFGSTCLMPITEAETAARYSILAARGQPIEQPDIEVCKAFSPTGVAPITKENAAMFTPEW
ncbi:MAG: sugar ABC transporter substrate-binding protein [Bauldia sp.]